MRRIFLVLFVLMLAVPAEAGPFGALRRIARTAQKIDAPGGKLLAKGGFGAKALGATVAAERTFAHVPDDLSRVGLYVARETDDTVRVVARNGQETVQKASRIGADDLYVDPGALDVVDDLAGPNTRLFLATADGPVPLRKSAGRTEVKLEGSWEPVETVLMEVADDEDDREDRPRSGPIERVLVGGVGVLGVFVLLGLAFGPGGSPPPPVDPQRPLKGSVVRKMRSVAGTTAVFQIALAAVPVGLCLIMSAETEPWWPFRIVGALWSLFFWAAAVMYLLERRDPTTSDEWEALAAFGDPEALVEDIEEELGEDGVQRFGKVRVTDNFLVYMASMEMALVPLLEIASAEVEITQHRKFFIPLYKTYELQLVLEDGTELTASVPNEDVLDALS